MTVRYLVGLWEGEAKARKVTGLEFLRPREGCEGRAMTYFLTSNPCLPDFPALNPANGFVDELQKAFAGNLPRPVHLL